MELLVIIWLLCSALSYAISFAYWQREYPLRAKEQYREDIGASIIFSLFGPFSLLLTYLQSGLAKHGFKWY